MPMKNPPHPGGLIRREVIEPLKLSMQDAADILGVSRQSLSLLLNEHTDLTPQMALRIEKAFGPVSASGDTQFARSSSMRWRQKNQPFYEDEESFALL